MVKFKYLKNLRYHKLSTRFTWEHPNFGLTKAAAPDIPLVAWRDGMYFVLSAAANPKYQCFIYDKVTNTWYKSGHYYFREDFVTVNDAGQKVIQLLKAVKHLDYKLLSKSALEALDGYERLQRDKNNKYDGKKFHRKIKANIKLQENERLHT